MYYKMYLAWPLEKLLAKQRATLLKKDASRSTKEINKGE